MKILLVDDEEVIRDSLHMFLEQMGHHCYTASNGKDALTILNYWDPDLVVTDYKMPDMNGFELLKIIKNEHPEIKVVILTGLANLENAITAADTGAYSFCTKSKDLIKFTRIIERLEKEQRNQSIM